MDAAHLTGLLEHLDIRDEDALECAGLLASKPSPGVSDAITAMEHRLGTFPSEGIPSAGQSEAEWIEAFLRFAPTVHEYHLGLGINAATSWASLADLGLQLRVNRRVHGRFGLDTWGWMTLHMAGNMFRLGRLQFHLVRSNGSESPTSSAAASGWELGVHIPEDGSLSPGVVDQAFAEARTFFAQHFPDKPVTEATCDSWMLDPYLAEHLPTGNIASFARRFTVSHCTDAPADAVYFTFRQRGLEGLEALPRKTSLQRVVLERIDDGGSWQLGHGRLAL